MSRRRAVAFVTPLLLSLAAGLGCSSAPPPAAAPTPIARVAPIPETAPASAAAPLPLDPAVRAGRLDNGLRYFVRRNARPAGRAELWLAIDAGSAQEDDDQRGLAHFLEHMAFNGTERFPKRELTAWLERSGVRFGADLNASTGFEETVYTLTLPTDDPALLAQGLEVLEQWACCLTLDPAEVAAERGVVLEEWRLGRGAAARVRDRQLPILWQGSRYAERLPIGDPAVIGAATPEGLRRYYLDWYRPERMAVVAVGDLDPAAWEEAIRGRFARLAGATGPRSWRTPEVPAPTELRADVTTDPELSVASVSLSRQAPPERLESAADYRRDLVRGLWAGMLNARLDELRRAPAPPFLAAGAGRGSGVRGAELYRLQATAAPERLEGALRALLVEVERARRFGFSEGELERQKASVLRRYESAFAERDKAESGDLAGELLAYALEGEAAPGIEVELALLRAALPSITLAEVQAAGTGWTAADGRVLLASAPEKPELPRPEAARLAAVVAEVAGLDLAPYDDRTVAGPLVESPPVSGPVTAERRMDELGVLDWTLANGVRVLLKPTEFKNDEIVLRGFRPGGHSNVADADYVSATYALAALGEGGLGRFDAVALRKALAGRLARAGAQLSELEEGISGSASPRDVATMFELAWLSLTAPRRDEAAFEAFRERSRAFLQNRLAQPQAVFQDEFSRRLTLDHPRRRPPTPETIDAIDLGVAERVFRERFGDLRDFTFVLVGAFSPEAIRPLVERWLGGLPTSPAGARPASAWRDVGVRYPDGVETFEVRRGLEPKASVQLLFHGEAPFSREAQHTIGALADALEIELRDALREEDGGTYGVSVAGSLTDRPQPRSSLSIGFGCEPARVGELSAHLFAALERFRREGPREETVEKVRETLRREREVALRENGFWLSALVSYLRVGWDARDILRHDELLARVTRENLAAAARRYADPARYVGGTLLPEGAP
jgi:zinc protease